MFGSLSVEITRQSAAKRDPLYIHVARIVQEQRKYSGVEKKTVKSG